MGWHWGILASSGAAAGAFDLLETTLISTNTASVTFSNLNNYSDYKHLQIRYTARSSRTAFDDSINLRLNSITSTSYAQHGLEGDGSSVTSGGAGSQNTIFFNWIPAANANASSFGAGFIDILDFSSSSKNTTIRTLTGMLDNAQPWRKIRLTSGLLNNTAAITAVQIYPTFGNFVSGSRLSLYGVK